MAFINFLVVVIFMNWIFTFLLFAYLIGFGIYYSANLKRLEKKHYEHIIIFLIIFLIISILFKKEINMLP